MTVILDGRSLTRDALVRAAREGLTVALDPAAATAMAESHAVVLEAAAAGRPVYGVTTAGGGLERGAGPEPGGPGDSETVVPPPPRGPGGKAPPRCRAAATPRPPPALSPRH